MRFHSQNLNDDGDCNVIGSMLWKGRAWFYAGKDRHKETFHTEWLLGKFARGFGLTIGFGEGDDDRSVCLHACIPFVFSVYLVICGLWRLKHPHKTGIAIHNNSFWIYPFTNEMVTRSDSPWWERCIGFRFPWDYDWYSTEILEHKANLPCLAKAIHVEKRRVGLKDFFYEYETMKAVKASVSETYDYTYVLKNGTVQKRKATVHVVRMTWRMKWWPLLPFKKARTSIDVQFDDEVGDRTGSWKGGCIGCGYDMNYGETPWECLQRMERELRFK